MPPRYSRRSGSREGSWTMADPEADAPGEPRRDPSWMARHGSHPRSVAGSRDSGGFRPMTCYQISQGGEPVAFVAGLGMAEEIVRCQAPGHYSVEAVQVVDDRPRPRKRWRKRPVRPAAIDAPGLLDRTRHPWRYRHNGGSLARRKASTSPVKR